MAQDAKERAVALRKSLKQEMLHQWRPSFSDAETFVLRGLLLDTPQQHTDAADEQKDELVIPVNDTPESGKELSDEILFSLPHEATEFSGQKAELPTHHKPAKRRSTLGLWKAFESGCSPNTLLRKAALVAGEAPLSGKNIQGPVPRNDTEKTEQRDEAIPEEEDDDIASDVEVRPDSKGDDSSASSWDENDHQDNFDTWEVSLLCVFAGRFCCFRLLKAHLHFLS